MDNKKLVEALLSECKDCSERGRSDNACHSLFYCANRDAADRIEALTAQLAESERQRAAMNNRIIELENCISGIVHRVAKTPVTRLHGGGDELHPHTPAWAAQFERRFIRSEEATHGKD